MQSCVPDEQLRVRPRLRQLHDHNVVVTEIEGLFSKREIEMLRNRGEEKGLSASTVVGDNGEREMDARRTSRSAFLDKGEDEFTRCIEKRLATIAGQPMSHLEPLQITDYTNKQEYKAHYDFFNRPESPERTTTIFAYLEDKKCNTRKCGGATAFHRLKDKSGNMLRVFPKKGNAIMWSNRTADGGLNYDTLHSGEKLTCSKAHKVGLNAWFREQEWE